MHVHIKQTGDKNLLSLSVLVWNLIVVTDWARIIWSSPWYLFIYLEDAEVEREKPQPTQHIVILTILIVGCLWFDVLWVFCFVFPYNVLKTSAKKTIFMGYYAYRNLK